ncbi:50S ribosomal protein L6 [Pajaroellobacter abortibovis]|uniref:Large ribosomal subunit protein uL6 n=1 Tax=Pajaroellobacter abortibovis TaxID=1882918 RepID=A0A1L6MZJ8_9BACT|nr:50S ribosomal protein L6 [Pajaroellobacter abortibovis]APS00939.1 50S ribosomal protein L6 [Pajaroellobacter abortibovis]
MELQSCSQNVRQSRVGKKPVFLPKGVSVAVKGGLIEVKGPKGELKRPVPDHVVVEVGQGSVSVKPAAEGRDGARCQGLARALINTMVMGVTTGYTKVLQIIGTGYRAELKGTRLNLSLGYCHPIDFSLPADVKAEIPADSKGTMIILSGCDKEKVGQAAAQVRSFREPSPYGGKGVRFQGEKVREKAGKGGK